jgi:hypothetical protein|tara:strand:- start:737 stop:859 length:123 start_codon:yes stop_codon:yes gene_type:complete
MWEKFLMRAFVELFNNQNLESWKELPFNLGKQETTVIYFL